MSRRIVVSAGTTEPEIRQRGYVYQKGRRQSDPWVPTQPVKVVANGREVFNARVDRSVATLLKWAARDNDRTMLYAAELHIKLLR